MKKFLIPLAALALAACAGRDANPVAAYMPSDEYLSCQALEAEIQRNNAEIARLTNAENDKDGANVAIGAVGLILFWPALFALDLSDANTVEATALNSRNQNLAGIHRRNCTAPPALEAAGIAVRTVK